MKQLTLKPVWALFAALALLAGMAGGARAQTVAADTFAANADTPLSSRVSTGPGTPTWARVTSLATGTATVSAANSDVYGATTDNQAYYLPVSPSSANYTVSADMTAQSLVTTTTNFVQIMGRQSAADGTGYSLAYVIGNGFSYFQLGYSANGMGAVLGSPVSYTLQPGKNRYHLTLTLSGSNITTAVKDNVTGTVTPLVTATDNHVTAAGYGGVEFFNLAASDTTGLHLSNFQVSTAAPLSVSIMANSSTTTSLGLSMSATGGTAPYTYRWDRSQVFGFTPSSATLLSGQTAATLTDTGLTPASTYFYTGSVTDSSATPVTVVSNQVEATTQPVLAYNLVFVGNSLMDGAHSTTGNDPGSVALRQLGTAYAGVPAPGVMTAQNLAIGGQSIVTVPSPNPGGYTTLTLTAPACDNHLSSTLTNELVVWELTNEITAPPQTNSANEVEQALKTYCLARKGVGWTKILVGTATPRSNQPGIRGDFETVRQAVNTWVRANWPSFADGIFDPAADSRIGYPGDELSTTYYYQGASPDLAVHMIDPGYAIVADYIAQAVTRLNAASILPLVPIRQPSRGR